MYERFCKLGRVSVLGEAWRNCRRRWDLQRLPVFGAFLC